MYTLCFVVYCTKFLIYTRILDLPAEECVLIMRTLFSFLACFNRYIMVYEALTGLKFDLRGGGTVADEVGAINAAVEDYMTTTDG